MPGANGPEPVSEWMLRERDARPDLPSLHYVLRNLDPQTWYQLEVRALNNIGWSQPNDLFCFTTATGECILCACLIALHLILTWMQQTVFTDPPYWRMVPDLEQTVVLL